MLNGCCLLMQKNVHEGVCIGILAELAKGKKEEYVQEIKNNRQLNNEDMDKNCQECPNYPF